MKSKKGAIPTLKIIVILLLTTLIFVSYLVILLKTTDLTIEDKKLQTQIIQNKIFNSDCFSDEYGIIEEKKFTQENLNNCFENLPTNSAFFININGKRLFINENVYKEKEKFCSINSNILCTNMIYPITIKTNSNVYINNTMTIQIIVN